MKTSRAAGKDRASSGSPAVDDDQDEKKKLRNRLSQRAFRRRQAEYIRELQDRAKVGDKPDNETIEGLRQENSRLRMQLVEVQSKLSRLIANMQTLTGSVATTLGEPLHGDDEASKEYAGEGLGRQSEAPDPAVSPSDLPERALSPFQPSQQFSTCNNSNSQLEFPAAPATTSSTIQHHYTHIPPLAQQIPNIWTFEYQMGPQSYTEAMTSNQQSSLIIGKDWADSNSPFSDHIQVLQQLLKGKLERIRPMAQFRPQYFYQQVLVVLSLFNSITRPDVMAWYAKTRFYHIIDLTAWQLHPCSETFNKVHQQYRPTKLQLQSQYPSVIDWIPFPSIRDRLIQLHAANPNIDQIFCDAVSSYAVEAWLSDLIIGAPAIKAYIRVTDVASNISSSTSASMASTPGVLPAPDVATLFASPVCARAVFQHLNMDRGASYYKIDPAFFGKYPELYDHKADIAAQGIPVRPDLQISLTYPKPLDDSIFQTYRSFIDFSLEAPINSALMSGHQD